MLLVLIVISVLLIPVESSGKCRGFGTRRYNDCSISCPGVNDVARCFDENEYWNEAPKCWCEFVGNRGGSRCRGYGSKYGGIHWQCAAGLGCYCEDEDPRWPEQPARCWCH